MQKEQTDNSVPEGASSFYDPDDLDNALKGGEDKSNHQFGGLIENSG